MSSLGCKHVVTVMWEPPPPLSGVTRHHVAVRDSNEEHLTPFFEESSAKIETWLADGLHVLVHCSSGISRSATIVLAYLILKHKMTLRSAYAVARGARPCIGPGTTFFGDLQKLEEEVTGKSTSMSLEEYYAYTIQSQVQSSKYEACLEAVMRFGYANDYALMQAIQHVASTSQ